MSPTAKDGSGDSNLTKPAPFNVAIIGGGPVGCMLARLLRLSGAARVTVFEAEASPDFRSQGGTLDLHTTTGLAAVREADLFDEFRQFARYDGQYMAVVDPQLTYYVEIGTRSNEGKPQSVLEERPEIDRAQLRRLLLDALPAESIRWGHRLVRVEPESGTLVFEHGTESGFDLIVGADGAWSRVRDVLAPGTRPTYAGVGNWEFSVPDPQVRCPETYAVVNRGSVFVSADGKRFSMQQMGDGSLNVSFCSVRDDENWWRPEKCGFDPTDTDAVRKSVLAELAGWDPRILDSVAKAEGRVNARPLYQLPVGFTWPHMSGVTLVGDSAHLMTPFAGEGVNAGFEDAMQLSHAVAAAWAAGGTADALDERVRRFELDMFPRMEKVQRLTDELRIDWMFTKGVPGSVVSSTMARHAKFHTPWIFHPLVTGATSLYFALRKPRRAEPPKSSTNGAHVAVK